MKNRMGENQDKSRKWEIFGANLRQFRKLAGLSQIELALELGYKDGSSAISQAERGLKGMQQEKLMRLSEVLGVDYEILFSKDRYTDEQADMILKFYKVIKNTKHPHYQAIKTLLDSK